MYCSKGKQNQTTGLQAHTAKHSNSWGFPRLLHLFSLWETPPVLSKEAGLALLLHSVLCYILESLAIGETELSVQEVRSHFHLHSVTQGPIWLPWHCFKSCLCWHSVTGVTVISPCRSHSDLFLLRVDWCLSSAPGKEIPSAGKQIHAVATPSA